MLANIVQPSVPAGTVVDSCGTAIQVDAVWTVAEAALRQQHKVNSRTVTAPIVDTAHYHPSQHVSQGSYGDLLRINTYFGHFIIFAKGFHNRHVF